MNVLLHGPKTAPTPHQCAGFTLVEVTLALGLAAFGLLAIYALLPAGMNSEADSMRTTAAASLASAIVADLQGAPLIPSGATSATPRYGLNPTKQGTQLLYLKGEGSKVVSAGEADFRATVSLLPAADALGPTRAHVVISWPAGAASPSGSFEVVTAIPRSGA